MIQTDIALLLCIACFLAGYVFKIVETIWGF